MTIYFYKTTELNSSNYVKSPSRSSAILSFENDDKYCSFWSNLASLNPCESSHPNRVSKHRQYFNELNFQDFDLTNWFKCSDAHRFERLNILSTNNFQLNFYQDQKKRKLKLIPSEINKFNSDKLVDVLIDKTHHVLKKNTCFSK